MSRPLVLALVLASAAGCDTTSHEVQREQVQQRHTIAELQQRQEELNRSLQSTMDENQRLTRQIEEVRGELEVSRQNNENYSHDISRLEELVQKVNNAREKDRQVILDEVSRELAGMSQRSAPVSGSSPDVGYEHRVKKGDTLYAISKAYGTSVSVIREANRLKKGDSLSVGQVLFIPRTR